MRRNRMIVLAVLMTIASMGCVEDPTDPIDPTPHAEAHAEILDWSQRFDDFLQIWENAYYTLAVENTGNVEISCQVEVEAIGADSSRVHDTCYVYSLEPGEREVEEKIMLGSSGSQVVEMRILDVRIETYD